MILADKLFKLRSNSGLSQEQLAEKMNVSRQSISKWESGSSIPTMDKIVELSNIYGISTDYLLKDDVEELPEEIVPDFDHHHEKELTIQDTNDYLNKIHNVKNKYALGVMLCILSPVCLMILLGLCMMNPEIISENLATGIGVGVLLVLVAIAVGIFILISIDVNKYEYLEKEEFHLAYGVEGIVQKTEEEYLPAHYKSIALGTVLCIISPIPLIVLSLMENDFVAEYMSMFGVAVLLALVSCGVFLIVRTSTVKNAFDRLLQKGDYTTDKKRASKKLSVFSGAYWSILTALYLLISFTTRRWDISWVVWPVGAVSFAAIYAILENIIIEKQNN